MAQEPRDKPAEHNGKPHDADPKSERETEAQARKDAEAQAKEAEAKAAEERSAITDQLVALDRALRVASPALQRAPAGRGLADLVISAALAQGIDLKALSKAQVDTTLAMTGGTPTAQTAPAQIAPAPAPAV